MARVLSCAVVVLLVLVAGCVPDTGKKIVLIGGPEIKCI